MQDQKSKDLILAVVSILVLGVQINNGMLVSKCNKEETIKYCISTRLKAQSF